MKFPRIIKGENDILITDTGNRCIDMFTAHGSAWLGHSNREIASQIGEQMKQVWITGGLETSAYNQAKSMVDSFFPSTHELVGLYSTGMEAAEFAIRIARVTTKKIGMIGFENSMHGKSLATAYLGWDNRDGVALSDCYRLPFIRTLAEKEIIKHLEYTLAHKPISAVFVEPIQGSGYGNSASRQFYSEVYRLCQENNALLVFDEILTGFYRTGPSFYFAELGFVPDIILIGKAMGNGFPVSGVVVNKKYPIRKEMLPGSTYSGNALASAAVEATLRQIKTADLVGEVFRIEKTIVGYLKRVEDAGIIPRGKGALWILELPSDLDVENIVSNIYREGVLVGYTGHQLRLLPAATIEPQNLEKACSVITDELLRI